jgi:thiosulfate dehydrogenase (quinone) large subunit
MPGMTSFDRKIVFIFRFLMAWTFLYAASHQVFGDFSVVGFLKTTKTFHALFQPFTSPTLAPITTFLVAYGHFLIGLSLLVGLMTRLSAAFGAALLMMYWMAHMDWPYIENHNNFVVDYHIVYAVVLIWLIAKNAGRVAGLDAWAANLSIVKNNAFLRWCVGADA